MACTGCGHALGQAATDIALPVTAGLSEAAAGTALCVFAGGIIGAVAASPGHRGAGAAKGAVVLTGLGAIALGAAGRMEKSEASPADVAQVAIADVSLRAAYWMAGIAAAGALASVLAGAWR